VQRQCVNLAVQFFFERCVDHAVALNQHQAFELFADNRDVEVRLRARRHVVFKALIDHTEVLRLKRSL